MEIILYKMKQLHKHLFICLIALFAITSVFAQKKGDKKQVLSDADAVKFNSLFFDANKAKITGNFDKAIGLFKRALEVNPNSAPTLFELGRMHYQENKFDDALKYVEKAVKINGENKWYLVFLAEAQSANNDYKAAAETFEILLELHPNEYENYFEHAYALIKNEDYKGAIAVYEKLEGRMGKTEDIVQQKKKLYLRLNKFDKAVEEVEGLIEENPYEPRYYGILAELYEDNDMPEKALAVYEKLMEVDPGNPMGYLSLAEHYRLAGDEEKSMQYLTKAFENPGVNIDIKVQLLFPYFNYIGVDEEKTDQAIELTKMMIDAHPDDAKSYSIAADFLYNTEQFEEALTNYNKAKELDNSKYQIFEQILFINARLEQYNEMLNTSEQAMELFPNQPMSFLFNGIANTQKKKYEIANTSLKKGLPMVVDNKALKAEFLSKIGENYNALKDEQKSDEYFDKSLELVPDNAVVLNNYSYYISLREHGDLDKAEELIKSAIKIEPNQSSFEDTYGWVLYKMKRFDEAQEWIGKAMSNGGDESAVILEHYGDVLFQLGNKDEALEYWLKAKSKGGKSESLLKKIADKSL